MKRSKAGRENRVCDHCGGDIDIANPKGFCSHVYYPNNCSICFKKHGYVPENKIGKLEKALADSEAKANQIIIEKDKEIAELMECAVGIKYHETEVSCLKDMIESLKAENEKLLKLAMCEKHKEGVLHYCENCKYEIQKQALSDFKRELREKIEKLKVIAVCDERADTEKFYEGKKRGLDEVLELVNGEKAVETLPSKRPPSFKESEEEE